VCEVGVAQVDVALREVVPRPSPPEPANANVKPVTVGETTSVPVPDTVPEADPVGPLGGNVLDQLATVVQTKV
jgi:hypothetical protein